jgi:hypothetical protein
MEQNLIPELHQLPDIAFVPPLLPAATEDLKQRDRIVVSGHTPITDSYKIIEEHHLLNPPVEHSGTVVYSVNRYDLGKYGSGLGHKLTSQYGAYERGIPWKDWAQVMFLDTRVLHATETADEYCGPHQIGATHNSGKRRMIILNSTRKNVAGNIGGMQREKLACGQCVRPAGRRHEHCIFSAEWMVNNENLSVHSLSPDRQSDFRERMTFLHR